MDTEDILHDEEQAPVPETPKPREIRVPVVCETQVLAPFCSSKKPLLVIPIEHTQLKEDEREASKRKRALKLTKEEEEEARNKDNKQFVLLCSTYISQVITINDKGQLAKHRTRGAAPPGANPQPDWPSVFPLTKFHHSNWPIALR